MRIGYHIPSVHSIYAQMAINRGFENAFKDMGHEFFIFTAGDNLEKFLDEHNPHIFMTATHFFYKKYLNFQLLKKYRERGMNMVTKIDFWNSPMSSSRINEARSLKQDKDSVDMIRNGLFGDVFYHVVEQGDSRMDGFEKVTGQQYYTIPLAADIITLNGEYVQRFSADISYVGQLLPGKVEFFEKYVFPLSKKYNLKFYGYDWTPQERALGWIQRFGQYLNIPVIRSIRKPKIKLEDEAKIYCSSTVSINVHESYQRQFGGECNERTFKIPFCNGFEVVDNVSCIKKYFVSGKEIVIADNDQDWYEKVIYYLTNPQKREKIIAAGRERVKRSHTYHHRADQIIKLAQAS